jgi:hypothetical protein
VKAGKSQQLICSPLGDSRTGMMLTRISLQLWIVTACTARGTLPPGQPSPAPGPASVTPVATTIEETEAQLKEEIPRTGSGIRRFVTAYYVNDRTAADLLMDWFQRQKGVASVRLQEETTRTHGHGAGNRDAGAVYLAEEIWGELVVEGLAKELGPGDVAGWIRLLQDVPADTRWRLGPSIVVKP